MAEVREGIIDSRHKALAVKPDITRMIGSFRYHAGSRPGPKPALTMS
jgi:hypothetical protein